MRLLEEIRPLDERVRHINGAGLMAGDIVRAHMDFNAGGLRTWKEFVEKHPEGPDLSKPEHRMDVLKFLNRWGCRLKKGSDGEPSMTERELMHWWAKWGTELSRYCGMKREFLDRADIDKFANAFDDLCQRRASERRSIGPTASSKVLLALFPHVIPAWDKRIAHALYGGTTKECFRLHLEKSTMWSRALRNDGKIKEILSKGKSSRVGMGKLIDETLYRFISRAP